MNITEEELKALHWWCSWTLEEMTRSVNYTKEQEREGEVDQGSHQRETALRQKVLDMFERCGRPLK